MRVSFQSETLTQDLFEEMLPLLHKHWEEIAHYQDIPLQPGFEGYMEIAKRGCLRVYTARSVDTKFLVGYAVYFVRANLHYMSSVQAVQDILFVDPESRGIGGRLIHWCDDQLRAEGVQAVYHHVKRAHNFGALLERDGYELVDLIYAKRLDR